MKVLQLITGLGLGGAEQVVVDLATRLNPRRFRVSVCSILDLSRAHGGHVARLREAGVPVVSLGMRGKHQVWRAWRLMRVLREVQPDVLHAHMFHANVLARWAGRRAGVRNVVSTVHIAERRRRPWRFWLERRTDSLGAITVCVSESVRLFQSRKTGLPPERFIVIPNGIETERFAAPARGREEVRAELGVGPQEKLVGAVGRLDAQKGFRHLLRAFGGLAAEMSDLRLVIAGDGPEAGMLRRLADRVGCGDRVRFLGRRGDVPGLLHAFDVFVLPSMYEGMPLALIEAMAAGAPIVASAVDAVPEVMGWREPGGPAGRLVPPGDPAALAAAIREALAEADERVGRAQARARERYDVQTMVARYAELYDSLAGQTLDSQPPSA